jgi:hypothetical protein
MAGPNQSYILPNHPQFGYYPFFPPPYSHYAAQWAALAAANPYMPPPPLPPHQQQASQFPTGNLGEPIRHADTGIFKLLFSLHLIVKEKTDEFMIDFRKIELHATAISFSSTLKFILCSKSLFVVLVPDLTSENPVISSTLFPNSATDHLQNAQIAASAASPFIYAAQYPHSTYVPQALPATASPYATIASYHPSAQPPTIIPPQPLSLAQLISTNTTDIQQQLQQQSYQLSLSQQQAPILTSPKHDISSTKNPAQQSIVPKTITTTAPTTSAKTQTTPANGANTDALTTTNPTQITDLLSSSPSMPSSQPPPSLLSPITVQTNNPNNIHSPNKAPTASLNDIWSYTANGSPLNLSQAAAQTAVAAMGLLNNENSKNTEMANEIFKELTTPTKQNK